MLVIGIVLRSQMSEITLSVGFRLRSPYLCLCTGAFDIRDVRACRGFFGRPSEADEKHARDRQEYYSNRSALGDDDDLRQRSLPLHLGDFRADPEELHALFHPALRVDASDQQPPVEQDSRCRSDHRRKCGFLPGGDQFHLGWCILSNRSRGLRGFASVVHADPASA